jgi:O-antigen ligase
VQHGASLARLDTAMTITTINAAPSPAEPRLTDVQRLGLALVWLTIATSALVFAEPAPVDVMMLAVVVLTPLLRLVRITPPLMLYLTIWLVAVAAKLIAVMNAAEPIKALTHTGVTLFLVAQAFVISAFVMKRPYKHTHLIMHAYCFAAAIAAIAALVGYFQIVPGAFDLFTKYARASGTFKDPNVFGPFLVPAILYLMHRMLTRGVTTVIWGGLWAGIMSIALLLSFSRGAWMVLGVATAIFAYLTFVTAPNNWQRVKILAAGFFAMLGCLAALVAVLQVDAISSQLSNRATLDQSYDQGPEGRFGGQQKAQRLIVQNPFGIGAQQFAPQFHSEEPHNVYLAMFLNGGWVGGLVFALLVGLTCLYGLRHAFKRTITQPLFIVAYACFVGHAIEGFVIDLDHWRHFHLLMALIWGLMLGDREIPRGTLLAAPVPVPSKGIIVAPRPPRILLAPAAELQPRMFRRAVSTARRDAGRSDSRPSRASGRTFARSVT